MVAPAAALVPVTPAVAAVPELTMKAEYTFQSWIVREHLDAWGVRFERQHAKFVRNGRHGAYAKPYPVYEKT